jgi:cyclophilin family peptidyl-prolyl cis-trans isomerase
LRHHAFAKIATTFNQADKFTMLRSSPGLRLAAIAGLFFCLQAHAQETRVRVDTTLGSFTIALYTDRAPLTSANFLEYVRAGHYSGTIFHRVIANFVAQGGGYDVKNVEKPTKAGVPNESGNGLSNVRGSVGLARTGDPHSGTAQFYLNLRDNAALDPQASRWGYTVFARVVEGMQVIDDLGAVATGEVGPHTQDAPLKPVVIEKMEILR